MPNETNLKILHSAYLNLPSRIRDWLASEQVVYLISELNNRLGFKEEKLTLIPNLVFRLVIQDLEPIDFINELSHELGISFQTAKSIAEDIEHRVLKPIETELRGDVGIDIKLIHFGKPSAQRAEPKLQAAATETPPPTAPPVAPTPAKIVPLEVNRSDTVEALPSAERPLTGLTSPPPKPITAGPTEWEKLRKPPEPKIDLGSFRVKDKLEQAPAEQKQAAPFLLHQEGVYPTDQKAAKSAPMLNIKVKNYSAEPPKKTPPKPIAVQLEYAQNNKQPGNGEKMRVVNYSEMRTPINGLGLPKKEVPLENRVDLRKFTK